MGGTEDQEGQEIERGDMEDKCREGQEIWRESKLGGTRYMEGQKIGRDRGLRGEIERDKR